ncbi:hypothetical protein [Microbacterium kunmingense]|uniref:hypothetical protein n=1 Tax=Microbacterium kunmingense TaxID=2915939 RepID=UPI003D73ADAA
MKVQEWSEASDVEERSGDVVGEVAEAERGAPEVFEAAVNRLIANEGVVLV